MSINTEDDEENTEIRPKLSKTEIIKIKKGKEDQLTGVTFDPNGLRKENPLEEGGGPISDTVAEMEETEEKVEYAKGNIPSADIEDESQFKNKDASKGIFNDEAQGKGSETMEENANSEKFTQSVAEKKNPSDAEKTEKTEEEDRKDRIDRLSFLVNDEVDETSIVIKDKNGKRVKHVQNIETLVQLDEGNINDLMDEYLRKPKPFKQEAAISNDVAIKLNDVQDTLGKSLEEDTKSDRNDNESDDYFSDEEIHEIDITIKDSSGSMDFHLETNVLLFSKDFKVVVRDRKEKESTKEGNTKDCK